MVTRAWSTSIKGIDASSVFIEVKDLGKGEEHLQIIGLADTAVKESKSRVISALLSSGFSCPQGKTVISLSPADERKYGACYDLPIALALIASSGGLNANKLSGIISVGELRLDGTVQPIKGVLPTALHAKEQNAKALIVPLENANEAATISNLNVYAISNLNDAVRIIENLSAITPFTSNVAEELSNKNIHAYDFADVKGQSLAKRGMEIAAAGLHNIILIGSPGCGKSMLAKRLPSILPPLSFDEALETTKIHSIGGLLNKNNSFVTVRPFRSPHHTISDVGLLGGGQTIRPGEVTFAHNGVLFLDEFPEFKRTALEVMRQPIEDGFVTISRASGTNTFPARFMLVAAMNPCPCGYFGSSRIPCRCSFIQQQAYRRRISGPLLDRIDLHVHVQELNEHELLNKTTSEPSSTIFQRVENARLIQQKRFANSKINFNSQMSSKELNYFCELNKESLSMLKQAIYNLKLSARAYDRILRVARTIADLENSENILSHHILEAVQFRSFDRQNW